MHSGWLRPIVVAWGVALGLAAPSASAQALPSFDLERLELSPSAEGSLLLGGGRLLSSGSVRFGLAGHYERNPLLAFRGDEALGAVVRDRVTLHLTGAYGLGDRFELGFALPVIALQQGDALAVDPYQPPAARGLGTPQLFGRFGILRQARGAPVDLAAGLGVGLPLGSTAALARERGVTASPRLGVSRSFGFVGVSAEAAFLYRPNARVGGVDLGSQLGLGAALATLEGPLRGEVTGRALLPLGAHGPAYELLAGLRYALPSGLGLFALGGPGFGTQPGSPAWRALAGVAYARPGQAAPPAAPPPPRAVDPCGPEGAQEVAQCPELDRDGDGVKNGVDRCPDEAEDVDGHEDADGCPDPDNDADGIPDNEDACPNEAGVPEHGGCPVPDRDRDGVLDADDACPDEAGLPERQGCPFRDRDEDGIEDAKDACPDEAGPLEARGCPVKDEDGDGVPDHEDNCPKVKGPPTNQGCPAKQKQLVVITREKLVIKEKVYFATGKATILRRSHRLLDQVANVLEEHPEIPLVMVEGHTDSRGSAALNRTLSQKRAEAVRDYLVRRGVAPERLRPVGHGPDRPSDTNSTARGRENNRRVEFNITEPKAPSPTAPPGVDGLIEPLVPQGDDQGETR